MKCRICGRSLDQPDDPLSMNCGGDCWGCVGEIEADLGNVESMEQVRKEHIRGLRPEWIDPDKWPAPALFFRSVSARLDDPPNTTFNGRELPMRIWAPTRTSLDGRGASQGTTWKVEIEQLNDGSFLLMRYESTEEASPTSDHWYATLEEAYDECDRIYGIGRGDWLQR